MAKVYINALELPYIEVPFVETLEENATDNITLDGTIFTDFTNQRRSWSLNYTVLDVDVYDQIRAIYDSQFTTGNFPTMTIVDDDGNIPLSETSVRMHLGSRDIRRHGKKAWDVKIRLDEKFAVGGS